MGFALEASVDDFRYLRGTQSAIRSIDLKVRQGEFVVITGPAGSGKTTLCYCLTGVVPHFASGLYKGTVKVQGQSLADLRLPEIAALVGFVQQRPENQLFNPTVQEDVAFGPENLCKDPDDIRRRVERCLSFVGMNGYAQRMSDSLSGGQTQRVVLSCILALEPDLLVLDQPTAELDPLGRSQVYENIYRLNREAGKTIVLVEDRLSDILPYASRMVLMREGRIVRDAPPAEFFADEAVLCEGIRVPDTVKLYHLLKSDTVKPQQLCLTAQEVADELKPLMDRTKLPTSANGARKEDESTQPAPTGSTCAIHVQGVSFRYPKSTAWALQDVSLTFRRGEFTAIIGENGAGKTTLAKHFVGLLRPAKGRVLVDGRDTSRLSTARLSDTVGYLFQDPDYQIFCNSVFDEVAFSLKIRKMPARQIEERVNATLQKLGLLAAKERHPYTLSRGQRQRLALASILAHEPRVVVVDEPSTGLDYRETLEIMDLLEEFRQAGGTVLMITHDMEMVVRYAERSIVMAGGQVQVDTATTEMQRYFEVLARAAIRLPDFYHLAHALGLPPACRDIEEVARLIAVSLS